MKKIYKKLGSVFIVLAFVLIPVSIYASDLIFDEDLTISINNVNYTIRAGSVASSMTSVSDGTVDSSQKIADSTGGLERWLIMILLVARFLLLVT
jgi:hypothetical protein